MAPPKPLEGDDFRDPNKTGPRVAHGIPQGGLFSVYAEASIQAPPKAVYEALLEVRQYKKWCTWINDVTITKHPHSHDPALKMTQGTFMTFMIQLNAEEEQKNRIVCQYLEKLRTRGDGHQSHSKGSNVTRIRWTMDNANLLTPRSVLHAVWTHELEEQDDGTTLYRTWNVYAGWGAKFVRKKLEPALKDKIQEWARDLKKRVEELQAGGGQEKPTEAATATTAAVPATKTATAPASATAPVTAPAAAPATATATARAPAPTAADSNAAAIAAT